MSTSRQRHAAWRGRWWGVEWGERRLRASDEDKIKISKSFAVSVTLYIDINR